MSGIYGIPEGSFFENYTVRRLEDDLSTEPATLPLLHTTFDPSTSTVTPYVNFKVAGKNFDVEK